MISLGTIDWALCGGYVVLVVGLAVASARGQRDNEAYFVGGRSMNWAVVGISMFATSFSSISFLGLPQKGAYQDFSFYLTILFIPFVITPLLWWVFVPVYVRLRVSSGYEYLGRRFGMPVRWLGGMLYCLYALGWMGTMLYAVALTLQVVLGLSTGQYYWALIGVGAFATAYTVLGGLKAVVWTDVLQAVVLGGALVLVLFFAVARIEGGWAAFLGMAFEDGKFRMFHLNGNLLAGENFTNPSSVYTAAAYGLFMYLPGYAVSQNMIQRYVCAGSVAAGRGVVALSALINTVLGFVFLLVGTALYIFYRVGSGLPQSGVELAAEDQILPYFVATEFPPIGLAGLILAGLFAAAMSTIDSGINGVTSVIVFDWLGGREVGLAMSRFLTALLGALVIGAAMLVPVLGNSVIDMINTVAGTTLGMLLAVYFLGLLSRRTNEAGVLIGVVAGLACLVVVWIGTEIPKWWLGAFAMTPAFVVGYVASLAFPPPPRAALEGTLLSDILNQKGERPHAH